MTSDLNAIAERIGTIATNIRSLHSLNDGNPNATRYGELVFSKEYTSIAFPEQGKGKSQASGAKSEGKSAHQAMEAKLLAAEVWKCAKEIIKELKKTPLFDTDTISIKITAINPKAPDREIEVVVSIHDLYVAHEPTKLSGIKSLLAKVLAAAAETPPEILCGPKRNFITSNNRLFSAASPEAVVCLHQVFNQGMIYLTEVFDPDLVLSRLKRIQEKQHAT